MSVTVSSYSIYSILSSAWYNTMYKRAREGTRTGSNPAMFRMDSPAGGGYDNAAKVISGQVTVANGARVTFPYSFQFRCFGLSVQHYDELGVNWDYNSGTHSGEPTVVYASGTYDASGFYLYSNFSYQSGVGPLSGNFSYTYTAWGV